MALEFKPMNILVSCECSGKVRDAFNALGHNAMSCDVLPSDRPGPHYQGDVKDVLFDPKWDMLLAFPPCTHLCNSGVRWFKTKPEKWDQLEEGAAFFKMHLDCDIPLKAIENPIMHKYARERLGGRKQSQVLQPYMFGHPERKATCLWLDGLPKLIPTNDVEEEMKALPANQAQRIFHVPPGPERAKIRSETFQGIADAMAQQWGNIRSIQYAAAE